jgi:cell division protease FtsH
MWFFGLLPWLLLISIWYLMWRRMSGGGLGGPAGKDIKDFLAGSAGKESGGRIDVRFDDVAGQDNAKREVTELMSYLRQPETYRALGAEVPHGVLLMGPPGTGKTLLARALAGEAGVPFFHISASEFIEVFVGVGASRVRKMFEEAKKRAPCIIFIDELDSVGRVRGAGFGGGHDEREQTLNQILAEMDGFAGHEAVIVLAATNRPDVLDPALLRPGRFDRHVTLELPDQSARQEILEVHARRVPVAADVDLKALAAGTPGFSGADLRNLVNEAAMAAARAGDRTVAMHHFDEMRDRILMGTVRTLAIRPEERHRLAVHECGHTAVAYYHPDTDPPYKVTIIPRGRALGGTQQLPEEERQTLTEADLRARLAVLLAGRAAEQFFLGSISSGAEDDIKNATKLARAMVGRWGMSGEVGPVDVRESDEHPFLGREMAQPRHFSEATAKVADAAVRRLLQEAEEAATRILETHRAAIEDLTQALERHETLSRPRIETHLGARTAAENRKDARPARASLGTS